VPADGGKGSVAGACSFLGALCVDSEGPPEIASGDAREADIGIPVLRGSHWRSETGGGRRISTVLAGRCCDRSCGISLCRQVFLGL
jgi:hypothetical protein